jgi:FkbM family methyltransferase
MNLTKILQIVIGKFTHFVFKSKKLDKIIDGIFTGETRVIRKILKNRLKNTVMPVLFDVGAHNGDYSLKLRKYFPHALIYAFEPNPKSMTAVVKNKLHQQEIHAQNVGLSYEQGEMNLFESGNGEEVASVYPKLFSDILKSNDITKLNIKLDTIDNFCSAYHINKIDFLKIDVEGHEFKVLQGSQKMLASGLIDIIQFEVNVMNVVSRVFLKDFYDILPNYNIYRIEWYGLVHLPKYRPRNERFIYQNFLAIRK